MNEVNSTVKYGRWELDVNTLGPKSIAYLLHNGFTQSMTDAAAATKADKAKVLEDAGYSDDAKALLAGNPVSDEGKVALAAANDKWREERFHAIVAGTVGTRVGGGGPRKDPLERALEAIAEEQLRAICSQRGVAMPKADVHKKAIAALIARGGEGMKAKAQARIEEAKASLDEIGDLFGDGSEENEGTEQAA